MTQNNNEFRGFGLFNDLEDQNLQAYNRARIICNIMEDNAVEGKVSMKGVLLITGYFKCIPDVAKKAVRDHVEAILTKKGKI